MRKRRSTAIAAAILSLALSTTAALALALDPSPPLTAVAARQRPQAAAREPVPLRLAAAENTDPCFDFMDLHAGRGEPTRQRWFNGLRTDGQEPDYLRYWAACGPAPVRNAFGNGSADAYWCAHRLLDGEHGGKPWNTDHHNGEGVNIPQAKPVSKLAGLTERETLRWFADYVTQRYTTIWRTPSPCRAGY